MHSIWSGLLLLGVLIVVHECGHFAVARWLGVRVEVFSVGFGPAVFNFKRGHTQYRLSLIPLGGYIRMLGELPDRPVAQADHDESFSHKPTSGYVSAFRQFTKALAAGVLGPERWAEFPAGGVPPAELLPAFARR